MKRWNKTVIAWGARNQELCLETNVPRKSDSHGFHMIYWIEAIALPDRMGEVNLSLRSLGYSGDKDLQEAVRIRLLTGLKKCSEFLRNRDEDQDHIFIRCDELTGLYTIQFWLENGEKFCDTAIEMVREIFRLLGVEDRYTYALSDFKLTQETFFEFRGGWVPIIDMLKMSHHLHIVPSGCVGDAR